MEDYRFLADFDTRNMETEFCDVVILGSGIAGIYTALEMNQKHKVIVLTKDTIEISNSVLAQGGIAVSLDKGDSPQLHFEDTIYAGAGLCNEEAVWTLVKEAAKNIEKILEYGVEFNTVSPGKLSFSREAAHSKNRIIHAGDTTGKELLDKLISAVKTRENVIIKERSFAIDLITEDDEVKGVIAYKQDTGKYKVILTHAVICATGGFGQIYNNTTNPEVATGDGAGLAYRAGAQLMDLEFVQFHPTVLYHKNNKSFLISEAVRGEGAVLRNINNIRFMSRYHEMGELAPRDVVSRSIFEEMKKTGSEFVYVDITEKTKDFIVNRFPNIYKTCLNYGIDITKDYIPVAPAEHYSMGGIKTDIYGRTNIQGLYACGEAACNGIHGANRLASNSLLEGLVFASRISQEMDDFIGAKGDRKLEFQAKYSTDRIVKDMDTKKIRRELKETMTKHVGIIRDRAGLEIAAEIVGGFYDMMKNMKNVSPSDWELQNMIRLSMFVIDSALKREESRGAHFRSDFNKTDDTLWKKNIIVSKSKG